MGSRSVSGDLVPNLVQEVDGLDGGEVVDVDGSELVEDAPVLLDEEAIASSSRMSVAPRCLRSLQISDEIFRLQRQESRWCV